MPIRQFDYFAYEKGWVQQESLNVLRGMRLAFDGTSWLKRVLSAAVKEPSIVALGGLPLGLKSAIEADITRYKEFDITPVFVFNGIPQPLRKEKPFSTEDRRPAIRQQGWESFMRGQVDSAMASWTSSGALPPQNELLGVVFDVFKAHKIEFIRAPYAALAQLAYMDRSSRGSMFHAIVGNSDVLLYEVDRVIINIDFKKQIFSWIEKRIVLHGLDAVDDQFLDMCLLAGFDYISTFPPLLEVSSGGGFSFKSAVDMVKSHGTGYGAVQEHASSPSVLKSNYVETFCRVRCIIKHHIVFKDEGHFEPLHAEYAPNDLHELIGYRLPEEVYFYMMQGLIGPQMLNTLVTSTLIETAPSCNGETDEYRAFLQSQELVRLRSTALALLSNPLHPTYANKEVSMVCWFDPQKQIRLRHESFGKLLHHSLFSWYIEENTIQNELARLNASGIDLMTCFGLLNPPAKVAPLTFKPEGKAYEIQKLKTRDQVLFVAIVKCLQLRGLVSGESHQITQLGRSILAAMNPKKAMALEEQPIERRTLIEEVLTAVELVHARILHEKPFNPSYDLALGTVESGPDQFALLISRAACILTAETKNVPWTGPLSRDLLAFNSCAKAMTRSLRNLYEMSIVSLFLDDREPVSPILVPSQQGIPAVGRDDYLEMSQALPQFRDTNTVMGLIMHKFFTYNMENPKASKQDVQKAVVDAFQNWVLDPWLCVKRVFVFWRVLVAISKHFHNGAVFESADAWLRSNIVNPVGGHKSS